MKKFVNLSLLAILCFTLASCCNTCKKDEAATTPADTAAGAAADAEASADAAEASAETATEAAEDAAAAEHH